jgi:ABC-type lipoprotein release transport system permease subunit
VLLKSPAFAAIAIIPLVLGMGATSAVFTLVNTLLIRPLAYQKPQQLVLLFRQFKNQHLDAIPSSPPDTSTFCFITFALAPAAFSASYFPAHRATRADPMIALAHYT